MTFNQALVLGLGDGLALIMAVPAFAQDEDDWTTRPAGVRPCEEECDDSEGANRFEVYSGNVKRSVTDLRMAIQIGTSAVFSRMHSSRSAWAVQTRSDLFSDGPGTGDTVTNDHSGRRRSQRCQSLQICPNGRVNYYGRSPPMTFL